MVRRAPFFLLLILLCCQEKDNNLPHGGKFAALTILSGDNQTGKTGAELSEEVIFQVAPVNPKLNKSHFFIRAKPNGNGDLSNPSVGANEETGLIKQTWKLGCVKKDQALTVYLYYTDSCLNNQFQQSQLPTCTPIDSVVVKATAFAPHGWNKSCGSPREIDRFSTKVRTFNGEMYAVSYGRLFKAERGEGLEWKSMASVPVQDIFDIGITNAGRVYLLTQDNGVLASDDFKNWTPENTGITDPRYPLSLLVEDSTVFISFMFDGLYRLRPSKSSFWKKLLINGSYSEEYSFITRHPNGNMYLVDKWDDYWISYNSGNTWNQLLLAYTYHRGTEDFKIHSSGQIYIASGDATLAVVNPNTHTGTVHTYYSYNGWSQNTSNIAFKDNEVYFVVNFGPDSRVIYSSASGWQKVETGFSQPIYQFTFDQNGTLILGAYDGFYFWKE